MFTKLLFLLLHDMSFFIQHQQGKTDFINSLRIVTESNIFGKTTKGKDENVQSTEVHSSAGKDEV